MPLFVIVSPLIAATACYEMLALIICASGFAWWTVKRGSLTAGGAIAAGLMGVLIYQFAGWPWLVPLVVFFASSSVIGRLFPSHASASDAKQNQARDATQVLANGGVYLLLTILLQPAGCFQPLLGFDGGPSLLLLAAAVPTADTWSSEIGQHFRRPTWDLLRWRRVPAGLSGGVSGIGTLAGLGGAALIAALGWWLIPDMTWATFTQLTALGFAGMLLDSALGALLQATYRAPDSGALSDVRPPGGSLASGFPWMTNDLVNALSILLTVAGSLPILRG